MEVEEDREQKLRAAARLVRWRRAAVALNSTKRMKHSVLKDREKEKERREMLERIRMHARAIRAAYLYNQSSGTPPTESSEIEILVSPFLRVLLRRLHSLQVGDEHNPFQSHPPFPSIILHIIGELEKIDFIIDDADECEIENQLYGRVWKHRLLKALFTAGDLIDALQLCPPRRSISRFNPFPSKLAKQLRQIRHNLEDLSQDANSIDFSSSVTDVPLPGRGAAATHPYAGGIIGRERERQAIADSILLDCGDTTVTVAAINGPQGIGKTTLAHLIYSDPLLCSHFGIRLWVNVDSGKDDDILYNAIEQMSFQATQQNYLPCVDQDHVKTLEQMKLELFELLANTRFLLVVDALPSACLFHRLFTEVVDIGAKGSAVIVTTHSSDADDAFKDFKIHHLDPLAAHESHQMFTKYSFASPSGCQNKPELEAVATQIVQQCSGNPLALKMLGTYLNNKDHYQQWARVLDGLRGAGSNDVKGVLQVIFANTPSYLKLAFCTFSLQNLSVEEYICLWMALGFLYSDDPSLEPECIGRRYLQELAESSLFTSVEYAPGGVVRGIKMHDLVYDKAKEIAYGQGFLLNNQPNEKVDPLANIRYIVWGSYYLPERNLFRGQHSAMNSQIVMLYATSLASTETVNDIVSHLMYLRVLGLGGCDIERLPDSIGQLKHLRYLDVGRNVRVRRFPDSICNLWHLQTLLLHGCDQLEELPSGIERLQNLRYLTLTSLQEVLPKEIGQLTSLRTLGLANCPRLTSLPSSIKNLKNLLTLAIADCQEMDLMLTSSVEGLKGLDGIDTLLLAGLPKFERLPPGFGTPGVLKHLLIQSCQKLTDTSWINQFRFLHSLTIEGCPEMLFSAMDGAVQFNNLVELVIRDNTNLGNTTWIKQFVSLRSLIIDGCRNLVALDACFSELKKLERLEISRCGSQLTERCMSPDGEDWPLIAHVQLIELNGRSFFKS